MTDGYDMSKHDCSKDGHHPSVRSRIGGVPDVVCFWCGLEYASPEKAQRLALDRLDAIEAQQNAEALREEAVARAEICEANHAGYLRRLRLEAEMGERALDDARMTIATLRAHRDALQKHYDAAGPEHNLLGLLDLYAERERAALDRAETAEASLARLRARPMCQACWQRPVGGSQSGKRCAWCAEYGAALSPPPVVVSEEERAVLSAAVNRWGLTAQLRMLQEEAGELVAAVNHFLRGRGAEELNEELADVWILLDQMLSCDFAPLVIEARARKLQRLKQRLSEEGKGSHDDA